MPDVLGGDIKMYKVVRKMAVFKGTDHWFPVSRRKYLQSQRTMNNYKVIDRNLRAAIIEHPARTVYVQALAQNP